jgi:hypothetical protein
VIRGVFEPHPLGLAPLPHLTVGIFLPTVAPQWAQVTFLLDTGATYTSLGPLDAATHVGIPWPALTRPSIWSRKEELGGIGGSGVHYIEDAEYAFRHDDGTVQVIQAEIAIMQPTLPPQLSNLWTPSLLGRDLLQHFRVIADWPSQTILLE